MSINFTLSEDQEMIKESANEFAMQVIRPAAVHHDQTGEYPWEVLTAAWENGLMNTHIQEEYGGSNMSCMDGMVVAEEWPMDVPVSVLLWKQMVLHSSRLFWVRVTF